MKFQILSFLLLVQGTPIELGKHESPSIEKHCPAQISRVLNVDYTSFFHKDLVSTTEKTVEETAQHSIYCLYAISVNCFEFSLRNLIDSGLKFPIPLLPKTLKEVDRLFVKITLEQALKTLFKSSQEFIEKSVYIDAANSETPDQLVELIRTFSVLPSGAINITNVDVKHLTDALKAPEAQSIKKLWVSTSGPSFYTDEMIQALEKMGHLSSLLVKNIFPTSKSLKKIAKATRKLRELQVVSDDMANYRSLWPFAESLHIKAIDSGFTYPLLVENPNLQELEIIEQPNSPGILDYTLLLLGLQTHINTLKKLSISLTNGRHILGLFELGYQNQLHENKYFLQHYLGEFFR